jgi:glycosyltransferase involved in cell wall biosynthesis
MFGPSMVRQSQTVGNVLAVPSEATRSNVLVIVPAWNEETSVGKTVDEIKASNPTVDILVVDDGSGDRTAQRALEAGALVARLPFNIGVGGAMRTGYRYALRHGYGVAAQVDADGQHDPAFLPSMIKRLEDADIVIGARFARQDDPYRVRGPRRWAMMMLAAVLSWAAGNRLTDTTSGFRVINSRAIGVFAAHYPAEYLGDTVESLVIALRSGCTVVQEPVDMRIRNGGKASQTSIRSVMYLLRAVVALALALVRRWPANFDESQAPTKIAAEIGRPK